LPRTNSQPLQKMHREIQITADGSHTIAIPEWKVTYHSHHGAIQESMHVCIDAGLHHTWNIFPSQTIHILEIGWGTGLNGLLTMREAITQQKALHYTAIEKFPLLQEEVSQINYGRILNMQENFKQLHECEWEKAIVLHPVFTLNKKQLSLPATIQVSPVHCIYFDAFSPDVQPELWTQEVFSRLYELLVPGGTLVTYCSKSNVRRAMNAAGFSVHKIPGPWGKREMVRAVKNVIGIPAR
jgi:tRNA U34 5-methylaminomethyl-2-thiouridine-forming methyltransferase MnmC